MTAPTKVEPAPLTCTGVGKLVDAEVVVVLFSRPLEEEELAFVATFLQRAAALIEDGEAG